MRAKAVTSTSQDAQKIADQAEMMNPPIALHAWSRLGDAHRHVGPLDAASAHPVHDRRAGRHLSSRQPGILAESPSG